jgi:CDP-glucose 4,6-dehydratase
MAAVKPMTDWHDAFRGKRVLVTGDTGFKGSWLSLWLTDLGAEVTGLSLPPLEHRCHFNLLNLGKLIRHVDADIRDLSQVKKVFADAKPEVVFHLAAQALVRPSYADPKTTFDTNLGGSVNILEAVRATESVRALVYITSDKCYVNKEWTWGYRENDELGGRDPYSASKACAEMAFAAYAASYFSQPGSAGIASTRAGNVIGGGDWSADRIVPDCIRSLGGNAPIILRSPDATRPWQHVLEPLSGYLMLGARLLEEPAVGGGSWNFGPPAESNCTVESLAERMVAAWGSGSIRIERPADMPYESTLLFLNADKARLKLGWRPRWNVDRTVTEVVDWYKAVADGTPALDVSRAQIGAYESS